MTQEIWSYCLHHLFSNDALPLNIKKNIIERTNKKLETISHDFQALIIIFFLNIVFCIYILLWTCLKINIFHCLFIFSFSNERKSKIVQLHNMQICPKDFRWN